MHASNAAFGPLPRMYFGYVMAHCARHTAALGLDFGVETVNGREFTSCAKAIHGCDRRNNHISDGRFTGVVTNAEPIIRI